MASAKKDENSVSTLLAVSSVDGITPVVVYADPITHRLLTDTAAGSGTVTSVSVVTANGFAGTVATATTTPAITLSTTITGILKGNGTAISVASAGTDYVAPGAITTSGLTMSTSKILGRATAGTGAIEEIAETGTGSVVLATSPTLVTPALGTPSALVGTNITGTAAGLTAGNVTTNANLTGVITSIGNATSIASQTGTGTKFVVDTSPTLVTPNIGVATATSVNKITITAPATSATLTLADGKTLTNNGNTTLGLAAITFDNAGGFISAASKTLTNNNILTLVGTDSTTMTFPTTSATIARTDAANTFTGTQTVSTLAAPTNSSISMSSGTFNTIQTYTPSAAATATLDLSKGNIHHITMPAGNITIALSNGTAGQCFIVRILQDGVGSRTVTWFTTIKWAGGSAPTLTTTASKADTMGFEITGTNTYDGFVVGQNI